MINKPFDKIGKSNIDALIANEVSEKRTLEYKEKLPGNSDGDKIEFLAAVSSFANASGGDILYGVQEKRNGDGKPTGIPEKAEGLDGINADADILRLENIIRDGIAPRINGVQLKAIPGFPKGPVIIIKIPKSWGAPHMITFKSHSRFYSRTSAGKYPLDVREIRSAFALSEALPEKIRRFRDERIAKIVANETPVELLPNPKTVLHILPIAGLDPATQIDIISLEERRGQFQPIYSSGSDWRYNFDGFLTSSRANFSLPCRAHTQIFRNGSIEAVNAEMIREYNGRKSIPSVAFERELISGLQGYLTLEKEFGLEPPIFVLLSLLGIKNYIMGVDPSKFRLFGDHPIDRDALLLPDMFVENYDTEAGVILRPAFDALWQSAGWDCSKNYDKNGKWVGQ